MGWFSVTSVIRSGSGANVSFALRVDGIETLDELADELAENGVVVGTRYRVDPPRRGDRGRLFEPREIMLTREGIVSTVPFRDVESFDLLE